MPGKFLKALIMASTLCLHGLSQQATADVVIKAEQHPASNFLSTNWTFYADTTLLWQINGYPGSVFFGAGTQVAMPYNASYRFAQDSVISYDQRKLYEVKAGTVLKTPDYVPSVEPTRPPEESADEAHCVRYKDDRKGVHCVVKTNKEDEDDEHSHSRGAYTSVNVSVSGNGRASGTAKVEGCTAIATASAIVIGSGSAKAESVARAWGCK